MARGMTRRKTAWSKFGSVVVWAISTAASAALLFGLLGIVLNRSLSTTRLAAVTLVTLALGQWLVMLHGRAEGRRGYLLLMRVILSLMCLSILAIAWNISTASEERGGSTVFINDSSAMAYVKISLVGQSGSMLDNTYSLTLAPGARERFRYPSRDQKDTYVLVISSYRTTKGVLSEIPIVGEKMEDWTGLSTEFGEAFHRDIFAGNETPEEVVVRWKGSRLTATDEEEDPYRLPVPERRQTGS